MIQCRRFVDRTTVVREDRVLPPGALGLRLTSESGAKNNGPTPRDIVGHSEYRRVSSSESSHRVQKYKL